MSAAAAIQVIIENTPRRARLAVRRDVKAGAAAMVRQNWRIHRALFGVTLGPCPEEVDVLLHFASRRCEAQSAAGLIGHWSYDFNTHIAAKQAVLALRVLRRRGLASISERRVV